MIQRWEAYDGVPDFPTNEDCHPQKQDDGVVIKQEVEDSTATGAGHLPPE
jgi:hypothetical protein